MSNAVTVPADELAELRREAARYRWLRKKVGGNYVVDHRLVTVPAFTGLVIAVQPGVNIFKGSVAQHLDAAIDAEIASSSSNAGVPLVDGETK